MAEAPILGPAELQGLLNAIRLNTAATLAAAVIRSANRPHSVSEAVAIARSVEYSLQPNPGLGSHSKLMAEAQKVHS